jgi:DNA-binding transcriptional regulator LsrR (DeoR family)
MCGNLLTDERSVKGYAAHVSSAGGPSRRVPPQPTATDQPAAGLRAPLDDQLLAAAIAQRYYFDNMTRIQIAKEFGISRFKVSRLLESALSSGLVRIEIVLPASVDADLSLRLKERFGLGRAVVTTPTDTSPQAVRDALGRAAATLLSDIVTADDVLGVTSGRTIDATARHLTQLAGCEIIQLTGMSGNLDDNPVEVLRRVAVLSGGQARSIYAPLTVATAEAARALKTDRRIAEAFGRFASVTIALAAIGSFDPPESRLLDALSDADAARLAELDVIADVAGALLDTAGRPVHELDDRIIGAGFAELRRIPQVIVVGGGVRKARAILAALRSGLVTTLVTDDTVARSLLTQR